MSIRTHQDPSVSDVLKVILRHRKKALLFFTLVFLITAVLVVILPASFSSESKLLVLVGRESVSLDPVVGTGKTMDVTTSREIEINTLLEILKSREMLSKVVDEVGAETILASPEDEGVYRKGKRWLTNTQDGLKDQLKEWIAMMGDEPSEGGAGAAEDPQLLLKEEAITALDDALDVSSTKKTTVVTVTAEAHSPALAQRLASALVDVHNREHTKFHSTSGSEKFFRAQRDLSAQQLAAKRAELSELKSDLGIGTELAEYTRLENEKATIETLRQTLARDLAGSQASCEALKRAIDAEEEVVLTARSEGVTNGATDGIRQQLYALELAEGEATGKYTEGHPELKRLRTQLKLMRERFAKEEADRTTTTFGLNTNRELLEVDLDREEARSAELTAQLAEAEDQAEQVLASLKSLNQNSAQLDLLTQDVAFLERSYDTYSDSLEQSRIGASLAQQQISNVNVVQPATYVTEPVSPNRPQIAAAGLLLAIIGAVIVALTAEYFDTSLRSPSDVEATTDLPVLVALPRESNPVQVPELAKGSQK